MELRLGLGDGFRGVVDLANGFRHGPHHVFGGQRFGVGLVDVLLGRGELWQWAYGG